MLSTPVIKILTELVVDVEFSGDIEAPALFVTGVDVGVNKVSLSNLDTNVACGTAVGKDDGRDAETGF